VRIVFRIFSSKQPTPAPETEYPTISPEERPTTEVPTRTPKSKAPTGQPETEYPTFSPEERPTTEVPTRNPTSKAPTGQPETEYPTFSPEESPSTPAPSSSPIADPIKAAEWYYYPWKFNDENWCFFGDITNTDTLTTFPRLTQDLYPTLCDCCKDYTCHESVEVECGTFITATAATTTAATTAAATSATETTIAATTAFPVMPSQSPTMKLSNASDWHIYPARFGDEAWCLYGDFSDVSFMSSYPRVTQELYSTFCECCSVHICHGPVKDECEANTPTTTVATSAATAPVGTTAATTTTTTPEATTTTIPEKTTTTVPETTTTITPETTTTTTTPETTATTVPETTTTATIPETTTSTTTVATTTTPLHYFYPSRSSGGYVSCISQKPYPVNVERFGSMCECCDINKCSYDYSWCAAQTTSTASTVTTTPAMTTNYYYPLRSGDVVICVTAKPYPVGIEPMDICECCTKHGCTYPMDHCDDATTTTTTTVAASPETTAVTAATIYVPPTTSTHRYYPMRRGDVLICITGEPYPDNVELSSDICQCCKTHGCTIPMDHCDQTTTATTAAAIPDETTAVTSATIPVIPQDETITTVATPFIPEHLYYRMSAGDVVICVTSKPYPVNVEKYLDICECCEKQKCTINMDHCTQQRSDNIMEITTYDHMVMQ
jgi:hypothetical protein